jgi:uncharacterized protein YbaP (TraB family)
MRLLSTITFLLISISAQAASIWHVSGEKDFYLFGTVHVLKSDAYPLPKAYAQSFAQCEKLWLEVDQAEMEDMDLLIEAQQLMLLPLGEKLQNQLSQTSYEKLQQLAEMAGLNMSLLQGLKPWAAANVLTVTVMQMHGFEIEKGLDEYLANWAQRDGIPMAGLESLMWQINMLDNLGSQYSEQFIEFSTNDMENVDKLVGDLVKFWEQGDVESLYQQADFADYPEIEKVMLTLRNNSWMNILLAQTTKQTQCVAVGALHMAGPSGLLKQFERNGYEVNRIE